MLYDDMDSIRLSPLYDVVNTQLYTPEDSLALSLAKSKEFPNRRRIIDFGKAIGLIKCADIVDDMAEKIKKELNVLQEYTDAMKLDIKSSILKNIHRSTTRTAIKPHTARRHTKYT